MAEVSVIVPTYGDFEKWNPLAQRAVNSVLSQTVEAQILRCHKDTLAQARNTGAGSAMNEFLCFLDADDELDPRFIQRIENAIHSEPEIDIWQPSTIGIRGHEWDKEPVLIPEKDLYQSNYLIIGSPIRKSLFDKVGGFEELPCIEDWALFLAAYHVGGKIGKCPEAIYRVHVSEGSRNTNTQLHGQVYSQIRAKYGNR